MIDWVLNSPLDSIYQHSTYLHESSFFHIAVRIELRCVSNLCMVYVFQIYAAYQFSLDGYIFLKKTFP